MCSRGKTFLPVECCFNDLAGSNTIKIRWGACWSSTKQTGSSSHQIITPSRHHIALKCLLHAKHQTLASHHSISHTII